jgi:hypothetical protein
MAGKPRRVKMAILKPEHSIKPTLEFTSISTLAITNLHHNSPTKPTIQRIPE